MEANDDARSLTGLLRSTGIFHCDTRLGEDTALRLPAMPRTVMLHLVLHGRCTVATAEHAVTLEVGDLALLPHGRGHTLSTRVVDAEARGTDRGANASRRGARSADTGAIPLEDTVRPLLGGIVERLALGDGPVVAHAVCSALTVQHPAAPPLPATLDDLLVVRADTRSAGLRTLVGLIDDEVSSGRPGWVEVASRLIDVVAMQAVRSALESNGDGPGIWTAVTDPALARVMRAVTEHPGDDWSVGRLAAVAGVSRSALSQRFRERAGEAPMTWVTRYRMSVARGLLADGVPVRIVARDTGYVSEVAFRRAFARETGVPPGAVRRGMAGRA